MYVGESERIREVVSMSYWLHFPRCVQKLVARWTKMAANTEDCVKRCCYRTASLTLHCFTMTPYWFLLSHPRIFYLEAFTILACHVASVGSWLPTFRDILSVHSSSVKTGCPLSRNILKEIATLATKHQMKAKASHYVALEALNLSQLMLSNICDRLTISNNAVVMNFSTIYTDLIIINDLWLSFGLYMCWYVHFTTKTLQTEYNNVTLLKPDESSLLKMTRV